MTQPNDPWAAASAGPAPSATRAYSSAAEYGQTPDGGSSLSDGYAPEPAKQSSLFGSNIETLPSLFTLSHAPGTEIKGKILSAPRDVHSTCHPTQAPDRVSRLKQYWVTDPGTGTRKPGITPIDPTTGKPNDPVMNLVISMQTGERDPQIEGDDGKRSWFVSGSAKAPRGHRTGDPVASARRAMLDALQLAVAAGLPITKDEDLIDLVLAVRRVEREQPGVTTSSWKWQARITRD